MLCLDTEIINIIIVILDVAFKNSFHEQPPPFNEPTNHRRERERFSVTITVFFRMVGLPYPPCWWCSNCCLLHRGPCCLDYSCSDRPLCHMLLYTNLCYQGAKPTSRTKSQNPWQNPTGTKPLPNWNSTKPVPNCI